MGEAGVQSVNGSVRPARWPWILCAGVVLLFLGGMVANLVGPSDAPAPVDLSNSVLLTISFIGSAIIAALIIARHPRNTVGWLLMVTPAAIGLVQPFNRFLPSGALSMPPSPLTMLAVWLQNWSWWLLIGPLLLIPLFFPTGRLLSPRWRWVVAALGLDFGIFLFIASFSPTFNYGVSEVIANPLGWLPEAAISLLLGPFQMLLAATAVGCVASIFVRYRRAVALEKKQIQWLFYAYGLFLLIYLVGFYLGEKYPLYGLILNLSFVSIPLAIGISILRYRLWDIDLIIRRTLQYGMLSLVLGLVYFGLVISIGQVIRGITGQESPLAVVFSTLIIAALFNPLRRSLQTFIDRRFYRQKYDSEQALLQFSNAVKEDVEVSMVTGRLLDLVNQTVRPVLADLWLKKDGK